VFVLEAKMNAWENVAWNLSGLSAVLLLFCATVLVAQEEPAKTPPTSPASTVLVNGVTEPVYKVRDGVKPPRLVYSPEPDFSEEARKRKVRGVVTLSVVVTSVGKTTLVRVLQGLGHGIDEKAVEAVSKWKFQPATKDGKPVSAEIAVEVDFGLYQHP
jgi:TonB family protein